MKRFNQILVDLRIERGWTQEDLAKAIKVSKQAVSHYERGTRYPKPAVLEAIADVFNVDMDYLIGKSPVTTRLLTSEELWVVNAYRSASEDTKDAVAAILHVKRDATDESSSGEAM